MAAPLFYKKFNSVDVFVEDSDRGHSEFYSTLLSRLIDSKCKIHKIFPLGGRDNLIKACEHYNSKNKTKLKRTLFIADGDLNLILRKKEPQLKNLVVLNVYCIENYLVDKRAIIEIVHDTDGTISRENIKKRLEYDKWTNELLDFIDLFIVYAISHANSMGYAFISCNKILSQSKRKAPAEIDRGKIKTEIKNFEKQIKIRMLTKEFNAEKKKLNNRWRKNKTNVLKIVSAKKYLLPLLRHKINSIAKYNSNNYSLKIRLAKNCSLSKMRTLRIALTKVASRC